MNTNEQFLMTYPGGIQVTTHHDGPEFGYFWRIDAPDMRHGNDWTGPCNSPDAAASAAVQWLVHEVQQRYRMEHATPGDPSELDGRGSAGHAPVIEEL